MWIFLLIILSLVPHDMMYGPQAALIAESFTGRLRYSGASLGYQLTSVIAGGPAPLIAAALFAHYHSGYLFCAVLSLISTALLGDLRTRTSPRSTTWRKRRGEDAGRAHARFPRQWTR